MMYLGYDCPICNGQDISVAWFGPSFSWQFNEETKSWRVVQTSSEITTSCLCNSCNYHWEENDPKV